MTIEGDERGSEQGSLIPPQQIEYDAAHSPATVITEKNLLSLSLFNKLRRLVYTNVVCVCHRRPINLLLSHSLIVLCIIRLHLSCREKRTHMTSPSVANLRRDFSEQDTLHQVHYMSSQ